MLERRVGSRGVVFVWLDPKSKSARIFDDQQLKTTLDADPSLFHQLVFVCGLCDGRSEYRFV